MTGRETEQRRRTLNSGLPAAFVDGAEEQSRRRLGRGLTQEEQRRVLVAYPGDFRSLDVTP